MFKAFCFTVVADEKKKNSIHYSYILCFYTFYNSRDMIQSLEENSGH